MTALLLAESGGAAVYHSRWEDLLDVVPTCDLLAVDAPYSEKTHSGHDEGVWGGNGTKRLAGEYVRADGRMEKPSYGTRRTISYPFWTPADVTAFVEVWHPRCTGWIVSITDHVLAPAWEGALLAAGRYVFAPLSFVAPGSSVRLGGDGPSSWTKWIVVARPRTAEAAKWGTLPGAYILPPGMSADLPVVGGKPPWLMQRLVEDYSRPGDLVCDPCCGAGTTAIGALRSGRRAIVGDMDRAHADLAALWIKHPHRPAPTGKPERVKAGQVSMFGADALRRLPPPESMNGYADSLAGPSGFTEPDHHSAGRDSFYDPPTDET